MIPTLAEEKLCFRCSSKLQHFGNTTRCQNCGWQPGVTYRGSACPRGCSPRLVAVLAHGNHCNNCGADWQR